MPVYPFVRPRLPPKPHSSPESIASRPSLENPETTPRVLSSRFSNESLKSNPRQWLSNISKHGSSSSQPSRAISVESNPSISVAKMPSPTASVGDSKVIVVAHQNHRLQNQRLGKGTGRVEHIGKLFEELPSSDSVETLSDQETRAASEPTHSPRLRTFSLESNRASAFSEPHISQESRCKVKAIPARTSSKSSSSIVVSSLSTNQRSPTLPLFPDQDQLTSAFSSATSTEASTACGSSPKSNSRASVNSASSTPYGKATVQKGFSTTRNQPNHRSGVTPTPILVNNQKSSTDSRSNSSTKVLSGSVPITPFRALLLREVKLFPPHLSDDAKLITLNVGGSTFIISLHTLFSKPSKLSEFVRHVIEETRIRAAFEKQRPVDTVHVEELALETAITAEIWPSEITSPTILQPGQRSPREELLASLKRKESAAQEQIIFGEMSGLFQSPTSISPPRNVSTKPSVIEDEDIQALRSSRATVFDLHAIYPSNIDEENPDDWTPDFIMSQPGRESDVISPSVATYHALICAHQDASHPAETAYTPSLSSSPTTASLIGDSYESRASNLLREEISESSYSSTSETKPDLGRNFAQAVEVFLDRDPSSYGFIMHWLRKGVLPRCLLLSSALDQLRNRTESTAFSVTEQSNIRAELLAIILHPLLSQLRDLRDEAAWTGLNSLVDECKNRIAELDWLLNNSHFACPSISKRSESPEDQLGTARPFSETSGATDAFSVNSSQKRPKHVKSASPYKGEFVATPVGNRDQWI